MKKFVLAIVVCAISVSLTACVAPEGWEDAWSKVDELITAAQATTETPSPSVLTLPEPPTLSPEPMPSPTIFPAPVPALTPEPPTPTPEPSLSPVPTLTPDIPTLSPAPPALEEMTTPSDDPVEMLAPDPEPVPQPVFNTEGDKIELDILLPVGSTIYDKSAWNKIGNLRMRAVGYKEIPTSKLTKKEAAELVAGNHVFEIYFEVVCDKFVNESETIPESGFGMFGARVSTFAFERQTGVILTKEKPKAYIGIAISAIRLENVTSIWYSAAGTAGKSYFTSVPFARLQVNTKPGGLKFNFPPSTNFVYGAWSKPDKKTGLCARIVGYERLPVYVDDLPKQMRLDEGLYVAYVEIKNMLKKPNARPFVEIRFIGRGVDSVIPTRSILDFTNICTESELQFGESIFKAYYFSALSIKDVERVVFPGNAPENEWVDIKPPF